MRLVNPRNNHNERENVFKKHANSFFPHRDFRQNQTKGDSEIFCSNIRFVHLTRDKYTRERHRNVNAGLIIRIFFNYEIFSSIPFLSTAPYIKKKKKSNESIEHLNFLHCTLKTCSFIAFPVTQYMSNNALE